MKISVVIPVYNGEKYIENTVYSVLKQPYRNIEIIIIDDGSIDNTQNVLKDIQIEDSRIFIMRQENAGVSEARNKGMNVATGDYITFLDADDIWVNDFLTKDVISEIERDNYDMISFAYYDGNEKLSRVKLIDRERKIENNPKNNMGEHYRHMSSYFYRRKFLKNIGAFWYGKRCEDERFRLNSVYKASKILYCPAMNFIYRNNNQSITHQGNRKQGIIEALEVYKRWEKECRTEEKLHQLCKDTLLHNFLELLQIISFDKETNISKLKKLEQEYNFDNLWKDHGWMSQEDQEAWKLYKSNKEKFIRKYKTVGIKIQIYQKIKKIKVLNEIYEKRKYPIKWNEV